MFQTKTSRDTDQCNDVSFKLSDENNKEYAEVEERPKDRKHLIFNRLASNHEKRLSNQISYTPNWTKLGKTLYPGAELAGESRNDGGKINNSSQ